MTRSSEDRVARRIGVPSRKVFPGMTQMISDYEALEKSLSDLRNVLAVVAYNQEDRTLTVPVSYIRDLPPGCELQVTYDKVLEQYHFECVLPDAEPTVIR